MTSFRKKILPVLLAGSLTLSMGAVVQAKGNQDHNAGKAKGHGKAAAAVVMNHHFHLKDIQNHWAAQTVELMNALQIIKGYEDDSFRPENHVTQAEAIVMVMRLLNLDDQVTIPDVEVVPDVSAPVWAGGSIDLALKEGIVTAKDIKQANKPATRLFITKMLVNALDAKGVLHAQTGTSGFIDLNGLSREDQSYLAYAVLHALVKGYGDKTFQPNKPVTRAEMAVFIERLKNLKENQGDLKINNAVQGTIGGLDEEAGTLTLTGSSSAYTIDDDVAVFIDKKPASFSALQEGMKIQFIVQKDGQISYINASSSDVEVTPELGSLKDVNQLQVELTDQDNKKVEISFEKTDSGYTASVKVTGEDTLTGEEALTKIQDLLKDADVSITSSNLDVEKLVQEAAVVFDLQDQVDASIQVKTENKDYNYSRTVDVVSGS